MANKRQLKKHIAYVCGDFACDIILASYASDQVDRARVDSLLLQIAALQEDTLAKTTFAYDKKAKDFADRHAYNKARSAYYAAAYRQLHKEFDDKAREIVRLMNAIVPAEVRKAVSE